MRLPALPRVRRRLPIAAVVLAGHALGLWALQGGGRPATEPSVPAVVMAEWIETEPAISPAAQQPAPSRMAPATAPATTSPTRSASIPGPAPGPEVTMQPAPVPLPQSDPLPAQLAPSMGPPSDSPAEPPVVASSTPSWVAAPAPARLELPSSNADYLNNPRPPYPPLSRRLGEQGQVVLRVYIEANGMATQAEIRSSSGYERLDKTALQTVLRWRYVPGKRNGMAEAMWFNVPIHFVLE